MNRKTWAALVALLMIIAACGDDVGGDTTAAPADTTAAPTATTEAPTATTEAPTGTTAAPGGEGITMGILAPLSGELGAFGEYVGNGYRTAGQAINDSGLLQCGPINFVTADGKTDPQVGLQEAERMINDGAVAIMGPTSDVLVALVPVAAAEKVAMISPYSGTTALNDLGGNFIYRTVGPDTNDGIAAAKWISDQGYASVAVFTQQEEATQSAGKAARAAMGDLGVNVTFDQEFTPGEASYSGVLSTVLAAQPEVIYLAGGQESSLTIINEAAQLGYAGDWLFSADLATDETIQAAGADILEGVGYTVVSSTDQETGEYQDFVTLHTEVTGEEPGPFGANSFDGLNLMALALVASNSCDGAGINDAIFDVSKGGTPVTSFAEGAEALAAGEDIDYQGASGPVDMDDTGSVLNSYSVQQVTDGVWADVKFYPASELAELAG